MKKQTKLTISIIAIISILAILLVTSLYLTGVLQSITGYEMGWIPYYSQSDSFTNLQTSIGACSPAREQPCNYYNSKYWDAINYYSGGISGGDGNIKISASSSYNIGGSTTFKFKENLYKKNFAIDYSTDGICKYGCANYGNSYSIMGYNLAMNTKGRIEINPSILNDNEADLIINGQKVKTLIIVNKELYFDGDIASGSESWADLTLTNPRYKPEFDCFLDNDEILIFDEFASGSQIDISSLSYPVQKFCINNPPVIRSFTDRGIKVDTNGEILLRISQGGSYTVQPDQSLRIIYITKSSEGVLRCALNQAFNTKTKQCENILSEGLPDDKGNVVIPIEIGETQVLYNQDYQSLPLVIGSTQILPSAPSFICDCNSQKQGRIYPNEQPECWATTINGNQIIQGTTYKINDYLSLDYTVSGSGVYNGYNDRKQATYNCQITDDEDWTNIFKININQDGLKISSSEEIENIVINSTKSIKVSIDNKIGDFVTPQAGVLIRDSNRILDITSDRDKSLTLNLGINEIEIPLKTDILGNVNTEIIPYISINNKKIYSSSKLIVNYQIVNSEEIDKPCSDCGIDIEQPKEFNIGIYIAVAIVGLVIIAILLRLIIRRRS